MLAADMGITKRRGRDMRSIHSPETRKDGPKTTGKWKESTRHETIQSHQQNQLSVPTWIYMASEKNQLLTRPVKTDCSARRRGRSEPIVPTCPSCKHQASCQQIGYMPRAKIARFHLENSPSKPTNPASLKTG
mmetsp:Transcript_2019/g.12923  ORF Transcript_2019/g.12923 Transcript_2019/m.12923 type:complete len:133 (-) Transcript_2019:1931-2329(-)